MQVVHSIFREPPIALKPKRLNPDDERASKRLAIRQERDRAIALAEFQNEVKEIREYIPGWMPGQSIK